MTNLQKFGLLQRKLINVRTNKLEDRKPIYLIIYETVNYSVANSQNCSFATKYFQF